MLKQLPKDKNHKDRIYRRFYSPTPITLSEAVKTLGWGNNKLIRTGGIRVSGTGIGLLKDWILIKEPKFIIAFKLYLAISKGRSIITIEIGE